MTNTSELAALKNNHSVVFLIVHDQEVDRDWQRIYMKQANDKALKAKFAITTNPDVVEVHMSASWFATSITLGIVCIRNMSSKPFQRYWYSRTILYLDSEVSVLLLL